MQQMQQAEISRQRSEMRRLAAATREVIERLVATRAPADALAGAGEALEAVAASLGGHPRGHSFEGFAESANAGDPYAFFDRARSSAGPTRWLRLSTSGSPTGGWWAAPASAPPTRGHRGRCTVLRGRRLRYRRPTPLHTLLRFEGELLRTEGRKIFTAGRLFAGEELTAEAEAIFVTVDFAKVAQMMARRADSAAPPPG